MVSLQLAIAVYENPKGDIVIRQSDDHSSDEDSIIVIANQPLQTFIAGLQNTLKK